MGESALGECPHTDEPVMEADSSLGQGKHLRWCGRAVVVEEEAQG